MVLFYVAMEMLTDQLVNDLENDLDPMTRKDKLNLVKMSTYLLCQTMDVLEVFLSKPTLITGKSKV